MPTFNLNDPYFGDVNRQLSRYNYQRNTTVDGVINPFKQGIQGDCWLLSGINSLSFSEKGRKAISDAITNNPDGSHSVYFKGVDLTYTFSQAELEKASADPRYSQGDGDTLLIELAVEKYRDDVDNNRVQGDYLTRDDLEIPHTKEQLLEYGWSDEIYMLFTGKNTDASVYDLYDETTEKKVNDFEWIKQEMLNGDNIACNIYHNTENSKYALYLTDENGERIPVMASGGIHFLSVKGVDEDKITVVNPQYSAVEYTFNQKDIAPYVQTLVNFNFDETA